MALCCLPSMVGSAEPGPAVLLEAVMSGNWAGSTRRSRLPKDWPQRVAAVKARAGGRCEAESHEPGCDGVGRECDHKVRGDDHALTNLQWLSVECHKAKTRAEHPQRLRPRRAHPSN